MNDNISVQGILWTVDGRKWWHMFSKDNVAYCRAAIVVQAVTEEGCLADEPTWDWSEELYPVDCDKLLTSEPEHFIDPRVNRDIEWAKAKLKSLEGSILSNKETISRLNMDIRSKQQELREVERKVQAVAKYAPEVETLYTWLTEDIYYWNEKKGEIIKGKPDSKLHVSFTFGRYPSDQDLSVSCETHDDGWNTKKLLAGTTEEAVFDAAVKMVRHELKSSRNWGRSVPLYETWRDRGASFTEADDKLYQEQKAALEADKEKRRADELKRLERTVAGIGYTLVKADPSSSSAD